MGKINYSANYTQWLKDSGYGSFVTSSGTLNSNISSSAFTSTYTSWLNRAVFGKDFWNWVEKEGNFNFRPGELSSLLDGFRVTLGLNDAASPQIVAPKGFANTSALAQLNAAVDNAFSRVLKNTPASSSICVEPHFFEDSARLLWLRARGAPEPLCLMAHAAARSFGSLTRL